jgi:hypothetical protein
MKTGVCLAIALLLVAGCSITTPEISGVAIDSETGKPAENAWITAILSLKTLTVQGDTYNHPSVAPPHLRTDKDGRFVIPPAKFNKPTFPIGFGTEAVGFKVWAETIDDKKGETDLTQSLQQKRVEVIVQVKQAKMTDAEYSAYLQSLYRYCTMGRSGVEVPPVKAGCDEWELGYAIKKHERFVARLTDLRDMDQRIRYVGTMKQLAYLYKQKGSFQEALKTFVFLLDFDKRRNMDLWLKEYESQIGELRQKLQGK